MEPSLNPCSLVVAPSVFISLADTWLSCQSNMLQPVPKQQHSRVIRYKFPLSHLSTHSQLLGVVINLPTKLLLLTPGFVFMFAKSWGHKTCLYGIGDCSQLRLTTAVMLGRWLEVKVTRLRSVSLLQTNTPPPPQQNITPAICYVRSVGLQHTGPVRSYLYFATTTTSTGAEGGRRIQTEIIASLSLRSAISR